VSHFHTVGNELCVEQVRLQEIAQQFGTPCYVYSRAALTEAFLAYDRALAGRSHLVCYAVKANPNLAILNVFARLGAGFDIVSGGELKRVLAAGGAPEKIVFSGVGKREEEMRLALSSGILCFNLESESEMLRLDRVAGEMGKIAPVSLRVNPNVDAKTHPYISTGLKESKFGVAYTDALRLYRLAHSLPNLRVTGIDCHIGSQLTEVTPFVDALEKVLYLVDTLKAEGISISHLDLGGGLGIRYRDETPPEVGDYVQALLSKLGQRSEKVLFEPGRSLVGNAGLLLTRIEYIKRGEDRNFAIVDAAMNDLMRPALYDAYHEIVAANPADVAACKYEIVGPVCESGDFLGRNRELRITENDLLAVLSAGAYGMSMSSNYNTRPRVAEVMVDGDHVYLVRAREKIEDLFALENPLP
jgi:diaminopimelate decarboxylase